jgi:hypothetical protein
MNYEAIDVQLQELAFTLRGAARTTVDAEMARLRRIAMQITDDLWRTRALQRVEELPDLVRGPPLGNSAQYSQAVSLVGRVHGFKGSSDERIAEADRVSRVVAGLADQAPPDERVPIRRMNSSLLRLIEERRT